MKRCSLLLLAGLTLLSLAVALAADPPNFGGTWKANVAKSDFGQMPAPNSVVTKIDHKEPSIKVATTYSGEQGEMTFERALSTDGKETEGQFGPMTLKSTAKWEGATLVVESKGSGDMGDFKLAEKWNLSEDGKTMTVNSTMSGGMGEMTQKVVSDKQ